MNEAEDIRCIYNSSPSPEGAIQLAALQKAVDKALERKRRLGQYAVIWRDGKPLLQGEDAPIEAVK
ncbi:MAG: hypothetical protein B7X12_04030 [Halothiobacillus sp. 20-53-49]|nr:hypothetical protein [Halothiobacillaceae bacterium]OYV46719.1 MAG: hypothetical protein B7X12_04030 [Halothiobacillus sp. 20-53-49]HUN00050.1 hypothetical protein [Halothiobacillus sp.]